MRKLLAGLLIAVMLLVGCNGAGIAPANDTTLPASNAALTSPPQDMTWISPGKVAVGNFYPGARAEWIIQVHNGNDSATESRLVTTGSGESSVTILLNSPLLSNDSIVEVRSSLVKDQPKAVSCNLLGNTVLVDGLVGNSQRTLVVTYRCCAPFVVSYRYPDHVGEGYVKPTSVVQDWVIVAETTPILAPQETRDILITLEMPELELLNDAEVQFWHLPPAGLLYLAEEKEQIHAELELVAKSMPSQEERDKMLAQIPQTVRELMLACPETNLLMYLQDKGTVSLVDFGKERTTDSTLVGELESQGYVSLGDLRKDNWEFWISVKDISQAGMVKTELCSRWLVLMR